MFQLLQDQGSTTILVAVVDGEVTVDQINAAMKAATTESFGYTEEQLVSSDIVGMHHCSMLLKQWLTH